MICSTAGPGSGVRAKVQCCALRYEAKWLYKTDVIAQPGGMPFPEQSSR